MYSGPSLRYKLHSQLHPKTPLSLPDSNVNISAHISARTNYKENKLGKEVMHFFTEFKQIPSLPLAVQ